MVASKREVWYSATQPALIGIGCQQTEKEGFLFLTGYRLCLWSMHAQFWWWRIFHKTHGVGENQLFIFMNWAWDRKNGGGMAWKRGHPECLPTSKRRLWLALEKHTVLQIYLNSLASHPKCSCTHSFLWTDKSLVEWTEGVFWDDVRAKVDRVPENERRLMAPLLIRNHTLWGQICPES